MKHSSLARHEQVTKVVYVILLTLAGLTAFILFRRDPGPFHRFLGPVNPVMVVAGSGIFGYVCLRFLHRKYQLTIMGPFTSKNIAFLILVSMIFGTIVICIDFSFDLPSGFNVPFPSSIFFYPVIGLVAEFFFHVFPISIVAGIFCLVLRSGLQSRILTYAMAIAACLEPAYHAYHMVVSGDYTMTSTTIIGIHILLISIFQMHVLRHSGFFHMYLFRLLYYLIWHVIWGALRLHILF